MERVGRHDPNIASEHIAIMNNISQLSMISSPLSTIVRACREADTHGVKGKYCDGSAKYLSESEASKPYSATT